jgi:hypothetical protein
MCGERMESGAKVNAGLSASGAGESPENSPAIYGWVNPRRSFKSRRDERDSIQHQELKECRVLSSLTGLVWLVGPLTQR